MAASLMPEGFDIDPTTGMPRRRSASRATDATDPLAPLPITTTNAGFADSPSTKKSAAPPAPALPPAASTPQGSFGDAAPFAVTGQGQALGGVSPGGSGGAVSGLNVSDPFASSAALLDPAVKASIQQMLQSTDTTATATPATTQTLTGTTTDQTTATTVPQGQAFAGTTATANASARNPDDPGRQGPGGPGTTPGDGGGTGTGGDGRTPGGTGGGTGASHGGEPATFTQASTFQDLVDYLNKGHLDPTAAQAIVLAYAKAHGLSGAVGNGFNYGEFDTVRQKYYVPGADIRYENGQWVAHPFGAGGDATATAAPTLPSWQEDPAWHDAILKLLQEGNTPVDPNDPIIKAQMDAARVQGTRDIATARNAAAERAAAEGLPTAAFDQAVTGNQEKLGENLSGLQASLMTNELQNRRAQVVNALGFASGEDARSLQAYLGQIDAALRQTGLSQQNQQFYDSLQLQYVQEQDLMNRFLQSLLASKAA